MKKNKRNQEQSDYPNFPRPQLNLKKDTRKGLAVVLFIVLAIIFALSLANVAGPFGEVANKGVAVNLARLITSIV